METVQPPFLAGICSPGLTPVQQGAEHTGLVDVQFRLGRQEIVAPNTLVEFGHDCSGFPDPARYFCVQGEGIGNSGP